MADVKIRRALRQISRPSQQGHGDVQSADIFQRNFIFRKSKDLPERKRNRKQCAYQKEKALDNLAI